MNGQLLRVILIQVCLWSTIAGARLALPLLALQQEHGTVLVGFMLALFALTQLFLALPAGRFADRHGIRWPVELSALAGGAGVLAVALYPTFPVFCLAALMTGGSTGVAVIATQRHVGHMAQGPVELRQAFSWLAVAPALGNFIGPFCAGVLIDYAGDHAGDATAYRITFIALAVYPVLSWLLLRGVRDIKRDEALPSPQAIASLPSSLLRMPMFRRLLFINWLQGVSWDLHVFAVPLLGHERGLSATAIGTILGLFAIATVVVRLALPWLSLRAEERNIIGLSTISTGLLLVVYPLTPGLLSMALCSVLLGLAMGAVQPLVMTLLHQVTPTARHGEALGLRLMFVMASSVAVPILFGATSVVVGIAGVFWLVGGVVACGTRAVRGLRST